MYRVIEASIKALTPWRTVLWLPARGPRLAPLLPLALNALLGCAIHGLQQTLCGLELALQP